MIMNKLEEKVLTTTYTHKILTKNRERLSCIKSLSAVMITKMLLQWLVSSHSYSTSVAPSVEEGWNSINTEVIVIGSSGMQAINGKKD